MPLRDDILRRRETLSDLIWAAEERFRDGEYLLGATRLSGAVYLLGLSAEMWLKAACFRLRGATPATPVIGQLGPAKAWMQAQAPGVQAESYHSLLFWAEYLIRFRAIHGPDLSSDLIGELRHHVSHRLYADWKIDLRYRFAPITDRQAWRVYNDVLWVRQTWLNLWR